MDAAPLRCRAHAARVGEADGYLLPEGVVALPLAPPLVVVSVDVLPLGAALGDEAEPLGGVVVVVVLLELESDGGTVDGDADGEVRSPGRSPTRSVRDSLQPAIRPAPSASTQNPLSNFCMV